MRIPKHLALLPAILGTLLVSPADGQVGSVAGPGKYSRQMLVGYARRDPANGSVSELAVFADGAVRLTEAPARSVRIYLGRLEMAEIAGLGAAVRNLPLARSLAAGPILPGDRVLKMHVGGTLRQASAAALGAAGRTLGDWLDAIALMVRRGWLSDANRVTTAGILPGRPAPRQFVAIDRATTSAVLFQIDAKGRRWVADVRSLGAIARPALPEAKAHANGLILPVLPRKRSMADEKQAHTAVIGVPPAPTDRKFVRYYTH